ncbi:MAG: HD domain-containing protein [Clostridium sp.]|nr:HD domain-containing protein [Clostridium sp.]
MSIILEKALDFTKDYFKSFCCGHDFEHVLRVYKNAQDILKNECEADSEIVLLATILHDVDDTKLVKNKNLEYQNTKKILNELDISNNKIEKITNIIATVSMQEYLRGNRPSTLEAKIVFDADKLDQIGAIAIARSFAYGARQNRKIFDLDRFPTPHYEGKYPNGYDSSINYIIEVLMNIKSMLFTQTAKEMAQKRYEFMVQYLREFFDEQGNQTWSDYFFSRTKYWSTGNSSD